jgi:hypothetical protein
MMEKLKELLAVREARLLVLRSELAKALAERAGIDSELAALCAELQQIDEQHRVWEDQWQNWLQDDRVLRHGQDYNLYHVTLTAWAEGVRDKQAQVQVRRASADEQVNTARKAVLKAQQRVDLLRREHTAAVRRTRARTAGLIESRAIEDLACHDLFVQRAAE